MVLEKENSLDDNKGLEHWMEVWRKERKEWEASHNIINLKFQVNKVKSVRRLTYIQGVSDKSLLIYLKKCLRNSKIMMDGVFFIYIQCVLKKKLGS